MALFGGPGGKLGWVAEIEGEILWKWDLWWFWGFPESSFCVCVNANFPPSPSWKEAKEMTASSNAFDSGTPCHKRLPFKCKGLDKPLEAVLTTKKPPLSAICLPTQCQLRHLKVWSWFLSIAICPYPWFMHAGKEKTIDLLIAIIWAAVTGMFKDQGPRLLATRHTVYTWI